MTAARRTERCCDFASAVEISVDGEGSDREKVWGEGERGDL